MMTLLKYCEECKRDTIHSVLEVGKRPPQYPTPLQFPFCEECPGGDFAGAKPAYVLHAINLLKRREQAEDRNRRGKNGVLQHPIHKVYDPPPTPASDNRKPDHIENKAGNTY